MQLNETSWFYDVLRNVRDQDCVQDVLVEIMELDEDWEYWGFPSNLYTNVRGRIGSNKMDERLKTY